MTSSTAVSAEPFIDGGHIDRGPHILFPSLITLSQSLLQQTFMTPLHFPRYIYICYVIACEAWYHVLYFTLNHAFQNASLAVALRTLAF
jgi:hypothetical protein